jgi:tetratricopeptide (TPR) repeat protein
MKLIPCLLACVLSTLPGLAAPTPSAAAAAMRNQVGNQIWQQQMSSNLSRMAVYRAENTEAEASGHYTIWGRDTVLSGYGSLQVEKPSFLRGVQRRSVLLVANVRYLSGLTDSIAFTNAWGEVKKARPFGENWLFLERDGRVKTYAYTPGGEVTHFSIADSALLELEKHESRLRAELQTIHMAAHLYGGGAPQASGHNSFPRPDADFDFAVKAYNALYGKNPPSGKGAHREGLGSYFAADSITEYAHGQLNLRDMQDFMELSLKARYLCGAGKAAEAAPLLAKADAMLPGAYFTSQARGLCAQTSGDIRKALYHYQVAYKTAPAGMAERYYAKVRAYRKILGE